MKIEERHDGLRADILDAPSTCDMSLGRFKESGCDLVGCFRAELAIPSFEQPGGHGEFGGAIRPGHHLAIGFAQNRVNQAGGGRPAQALDQLDTLAHSGMRRNAIEIAKLINAHAQRDAYFEFGRPWNPATDQIIELGLIAETSEDDLSGEACVSRVELRRTLKQQIRSVATLADLAENVEGGLARGRDHVLF